MTKSFVFRALFLGILSSSVLFGNNISKFSINDAINGEYGQRYLYKHIGLEFGSGYTGEVFKGRSIKKSTGKNFDGMEASSYDILSGEVKTISKKDSRSSIEKGCQYAFVATLKRAQKMAAKQGYSKVVNITTYFKDNKLDSKDEFICGYKNLKGVGISFDYAR